MRTPGNDCMSLLKRKVLSTILVGALIVGCAPAPLRNTGVTPSFSEGLSAIEKKDFANASYHFSELAKEGDPGAMNNLGVALLMADRKDDAIYWFSKAAHYGNPEARETLAKMHEQVPPADMIGRHPSQVHQEEVGLFVVSILAAALIGVSLRYAGNTYSPKSQYSTPQNLGNTENVHRAGATNSTPPMPMANNFNAQSPATNINQSPVTNINYSNGVTGQRIGNMTIYSNGVYSQTNGSLTTFNNGQSAIQSVGSTFYSNGVSSQQSGGATLFSNGQVCQLIGNILSCN